MSTFISGRRHSRITAILLAVLALIAATALTACNKSVDDSTENTVDSASSAASSASSATEAASEEGSWPRTVASEEFEGAEVTIPEKPQRIVSTSVSLTGSLLAIDAPVVASGAGRPNSNFADDRGFFKQWADAPGVENIDVLYDNEPDVEAILAAKPDLIVVSTIGRDSAMPVIDQLKAAAPTIVVGYDDKPWQEVTTILGQAIGHEKQAAEAIDTFEKRVDEVKNSITLPDQPVNIMRYLTKDGSANIMTPASGQGQLLEELGFTIADIPSEIVDEKEAAHRSDRVHVSAENLPVALNGKGIFITAEPDEVIDDVLANPALAKVEPVADKKIWSLGADTFRMDYFSATNIVNRIEADFK